MINDYTTSNTTIWRLHTATLLSIYTMKQQHYRKRS